MYQPACLQSGDLVRFSRGLLPDKDYGILFYLNEHPFLLLPDGSIRENIPIESLEWVCHTALVHSDYFRSLEQVRLDFSVGTFDHVIGSFTGGSLRTMDNRLFTHFKKGLVE